MKGFYRIFKQTEWAAILVFTIQISLGRGVLYAQAFTEISAGLTGVDRCALDWGDYDNDGDLDILLSGALGTGVSRVYRNDAGVFTNISASLDSCYYSAASWGDYDNDGDLDILLTGFNGTARISKVYRNDSGTFTDISAGLVGVYESAVAWGDYDNDGDLDILLAGSDGGTYYSRVYRNDDGAFTDIVAGLPGVVFPALAWGDYDNDGDLDILLTGQDVSATRISKIYQNTNGAFSDIAAGLPGVWFGSVAWGDFDQDGDLDFILTGGDQGDNRITKMYRNDGGIFTEISTSLPGIAESSVAWGDYDNDGDLDILMTGSDGAALSRIYRNDSGIFTDISAGLAGCKESSAAWGDYDNDGDLDIIYAGDTGAGYITKIYRNNIGTANTLPSLPTGLTSAPTANSVTLSWNKSTDTETSLNGLTYNLRVGTTPGGCEIVSPMANSSNGYRKISRLGNTNHKNSWTIKDLPTGTYYWSVQAIDNTFAGSMFATEQIFSIIEPRALDSLALVALYDSTGGMGWTTKTNWKTSNPIDTWYGVNVSGGRVNSLDLTGNNLAGNLPAAIGNLSELLYLKLGSNSLSGFIRSEIGYLTSLQELYIHGNQFTGQIPPSIGNLSNLRILYLQLNYLTGSIPSEIGNLSQVQLITVSGNNLSGSVPVELGSLPNLTALYLNGNQFSGSIPPSLGNISGLQYLTLSNNQLSGSIPIELGTLSQLKWLWLASNQLSGTIPVQIGNLTSVTQLYLDHNGLSGNVPDLTGLTSLQELRLNSNQLTGLVDLNSLATLNDLSVENNKLTFEDIEPNIGAPSSTFTYSPQDSVGEYKDTTAEAGSTKEFTVFVGGASNQYQWYKNGDIIGGATSASYTIPSVAYLDSGTYHCRITNTVATALTLYSRTFKLHVIPSLRTLDSLALVTFYDSTGGDNWTNKTNWKSSNPIDTWYGVTVSGGRVTSIVLTSNNLVGHIPAAIGNLNSLTYLFLSSNKLSGAIPPQLWNLNSLDHLSLAFNKFSPWLIPMSVFNITSLIQLDLAGDSLVGDIPSQIGNLTNLTALGLQYNQLNGTIPIEIGGLANLWLLDFGHNQLGGAIPTPIGGMINLRNLHLEGNQLTGTVPTQIGSLTNLQELWLGNNQLTGNIPAQIGNLTNLIYLGLNENQFTGGVPSSLASLPKLREFEIFNNQLADLPNFTPIDSLKYLLIENNKFTFEDIEPNIGAPSQIFTYSPQDSVGEYRDTTIETGAYISFPLSVGGASNFYMWYKNGLTIPNMSPVLIIPSVSLNDSGTYHCQITNTVATGLTLFSRTYKLHVTPSARTLDSLALVTFYDSSGGNNWTKQGNWKMSMPIDFWDGVTIANGRVTGLVLNENNLVGPIPQSVGTLTRLRDLQLRYNHLSGTIPSSICSLDSLRTLKLESNQLSGSIPAEIGNLGQLVTLELWNNDLSGVIPPGIGNLTNLTKLEFYNNKLSGSIPTQIGALTKLQNLSFSGNLLSGSIPPQIGNLVNLRQLSLDHNQITGTVPSQIWNMTSLTSLDLGINSFTAWTIPATIGNLTALEGIGLYGCSLQGSIPAEIGNLAALKSLDLSGNQLSGAVPSQIGNLANLEVLYLRWNQFSGAVPAQLAALTKLQNCHFEKNQFVDLPDFTSVDSLRVLTIEDNKFSFEDIEPNIGAPSQTFTYSPQDSVGTYSDYITVQGTAHTLSVTVGGSSNQYQWMKNGVDISGATSSGYYRLYWAVADSGSYVCRITNTVATALTLYSRRTKVIVYPQPTQPGNLVATPVSSSRIDLSWNASNDASKYFISRSLTSGGGFNLIDSVNVPTTSYSNTGLSVITAYYYRVYAANQYGATSSNSNEASATTLGIAPSLGTPNVSDLSPIPSAAVTITVTATGTSPTVKLFYGKATQAEGDSLTMTYNGTVYSGTIPGSAVTQEGVWYQIRAQNTGGVVYYPATSRAGISVTINDMVTIWDNSHFYGGIPEGQYFTIAMSMDASLSLTNLWGAQTLEGGIPTNWRAWEFDQVTQSFLDVTSLSGDKAYFIFHRRGSAQEIFNSATSRKTNDPKMFGDFLLKAGWNAVPWPYTFPANIYAKDANHDSIGSVWKLWGNSGWEKVTEMRAFGGYMIYNKTGGDVRLRDVVGWTMMATKATVDQNGWRLHFIAESGQYRDAYNTAGVSQEYAAMSEPEPLNIGKSIALNFNHETEILSSDIRPANENGHIWDMVVRNTTGNARSKLIWEMEQLPSDVKVMLIDITNNKMLNLNEAIPEYEFRTQKQNIFKLVAGNTDFVDREVAKIKAELPDEFRLCQNYPNPFNPETAINFDVAHASQVRIKVYNLLGQEVAVLVNRYYETGRYTAEWNGKDQLGRQVASGMYIYRLEAGKISRTKKMMLVK